MQVKKLQQIIRDVNWLLPKEVRVQKARIVKEKLEVIGWFEDQKLLLEFEGVGKVRIHKGKKGYVEYDGAAKILARTDVLEIMRALAGQCKTYKGVWYWHGEIFLQSVPL